MNSRAQRQVKAINLEIDRLTAHAEQLQQSMGVIQQTLHQKDFEMSRLQSKINALQNYQQKRFSLAQPQAVPSATPMYETESTLIRAGNLIDLSQPINPF